MKEKITKEDEAAAFKLMERALKGNHNTFELLGSLFDLKVAKVVYNATLAAANGFRKSADAIFEAYLKDINSKDKQFSFEELLSYKKIRQCEKFYFDDAKIIKDIINEYVCYLHSGHLLSAILGIARPEQDKVDFRTLPINWNPFSKDK